MLEKIKRGDEVLTNGGIAGKVTDIGDNFITIEVAENVRIRVQKGAVGSVLPTGETACFLLAGDDMTLRLQAMQRLAPEQRLARDDLLHLVAPAAAEGHGG